MDACFVYIGRIIDHHCLNFLFVVMSLLQRVSYMLLPKNRVISGYFLVWTFELPDLDLIFILYIIRLVLSIRIGIFFFFFTKNSLKIPSGLTRSCKSKTKTRKYNTVGLSIQLGYFFVLNLFVDISI